MNVKHEKLDSKKVKLEVTLEAAKLDEAHQKVLQEEREEPECSGIQKRQGATGTGEAVLRRGSPV